MKQKSPDPKNSLFSLDLNHEYLFFRRTKIVATIGPASSSPEMLRKLIKAGLNVARINFSHGNAADHVGVMQRVRAAAAAEGASVAILADLCGPKIRVGKFQNDAITLKDDSIVTITVEPVLGREGLIPSQYRRLIKDVGVGGSILLDDGNLELKVVKKGTTSLQAKVIHGGLLKNNKGMNLPDSNLAISALTVKDKSDVAYAVKGGADYIALSFVRHGKDIDDLRRVLAKLGSTTPIIAKIEMPQALENIGDIISRADGIMVARGDLGVELPAKKVPIIQNRLIQIASDANKPVIVATQMLESMIEHARPTRAEVTDVAGACTAGADAVMLSAETASGRHPLLAVETMDSILRETEAYQFFARGGKFTKAGTHETDQLQDAMGMATAQLSRDLMVRSVFVLTRTGFTAQFISADRPAAPILCMTNDESVRRKLNLLWGVYPFIIRRSLTIEQALAEGEKILGRLHLAKPGEYMLMIARLTDHDASTNSILIHKIGKKKQERLNR